LLFGWYLSFVFSLFWGLFFITLQAKNM
jgi:hypothetical protein